MTPTGAAQTALTHDPDGGVNPDWSPNGAKIAFASDRSGVSNLYVHGRQRDRARCG